MNIQSKSDLQKHLQKWLDRQNVQNRIGEIEGIWQESTNADRMSILMANACEVVIDSMRLQALFHEENSN
jgi:hypothetical protein